MNQRQNHNRTTSQGRKALPPHARPSKPPPLRRGASYNHPHSHSHNAISTTSTTNSRPGSRRAGASDALLYVQVDDEESGMASFLQFCATCERQIITPGTNILYCSEACRKKDVSRPTSMQSIESVRSPAGLSNASSYFDHPPVDIVPQMSPTRRPWSMTFSEMSSLDDMSADSSSERTDWCPSELHHFHAEFLQSNSNRPYLNRSSTTTDTNLPSLVHSPSSSWGTVASHASYRPLPSRHNPFTTDHHHTKSVDLVIPYPTGPPSPTQLVKDASLKSCASTLTSFRVAEAGDISYDKRSPSSRGSDRKGSHSLKQLFSHDAMKAHPSTDQ